MQFDHPIYTFSSFSKKKLFDNWNVTSIDAIASAISDDGVRLLVEHTTFGFWDSQTATRINLDSKDFR